MTARVLRSVGHGTATSAGLTEVLAGAGIELVSDVRRFPGSRRHPQFGQDEMPRWLSAAGIDYQWLSALGGRRTSGPGSPNVGLRNPQFRAYADHMASSEFAGALDELLAMATARPTAVMCSESVWWRCHRRLLADHAVLVAGWQVEHLFHDGRLAAHPVTPGASRSGNTVIYAAVAG